MRTGYDDIEGLGKCEWHLYDNGIGENSDFVASGVELGSRKMKKHPWSVGLEEDWIGRDDLHNWRDVLNAVNSTWERGVAVVEEMLKELSEADLPRPQSRKRKSRWSEDSGDELCYDRLRGAQPYWRETVRQMVHSQNTVTILVEIGALGSVDHEDILWRGAAAIALANILEDAGYQVEIWSVQLSLNTYKNRAASLRAVKLKECNQPFDLAALVNAVSGWYLRTLNFASRVLSQHGNAENHGGMGSRVNPEEYPAVLDMISTDENRMVIADAYCYKDAVSTAKAELNKFIEKTSGRAAQPA